MSNTFNENAREQVGEHRARALAAPPGDPRPIRLFGSVLYPKEVKPMAVLSLSLGIAYALVWLYRLSVERFLNQGAHHVLQPLGTRFSGVACGILLVVSISFLLPTYASMTPQRFSQRTKAFRASLWVAVVAILGALLLWIAGVLISPPPFGNLLLDAMSRAFELLLIGGIIVSPAWHRLGYPPSPVPLEQWNAGLNHQRPPAPPTWGP